MPGERESEQNIEITEALLNSEFGLRTVLFGFDLESEAGQRLFQRRLFKMLKGLKTYIVDPQLMRDLRHIRDYVNQCEIAGDTERIRSLTGMPDVKKMVAAADGYFTKIQKNAELGEDAAALRSIANLADGYRIVELESEAGLKREGRLMQHCVGTYWNSVSAGQCRILSLRDPKNQPHCTMEIVLNEIVQFQGKQNRSPAAKYSPYLREFLLNSDLTAGSWILHDIGLIRAGKQIYSYDNLPDPFIVPGSLNLSSMPIKDLPKDLQVSEDLILKYADITELPANLTVGGDLNLCASSISRLPDGLVVGGRLILDYLQGIELPDPFKLDGSLYLNETRLNNMPIEMNISGDLHLAKSEMKQLPGKLTVGGNLNLRDSAIEKLPAGMRVGGDLDLNNSAVSELSEDMEIGGCLSFGSAPFESLPEDLKIGESLFLQFGSLRSLPENFELGEALFLNGCPLESLPKGLCVGTTLSLAGTTLSRLPEGLKVGSILDLSRTTITELPADLKAYAVRLDNTSIGDIPANADIKFILIGDETLEPDEARTYLQNIDEVIQ